MWVIRISIMINRIGIMIFDVCLMFFLILFIMVV